VPGTAITFTARVTPATATGNITFLDNGATMANAPISAGVATFPTANLAAGVHTITATYAGDTNDSAATSNAVTVTSQITTQTTPHLTVTRIIVPPVTPPIIG